MFKLVLLVVSVLLSFLAMSCIGGLGVGAASAKPVVSAGQLMVTCLSCGEQWIYLPLATLAAGCLSLFSRRRKPNDECPKCHSRAVAFGHSQHAPASGRRHS